MTVFQVSPEVLGLFPWGKGSVVVGLVVLLHSCPCYSRRTGVLAPA